MIRLISRNLLTLLFIGGLLGGCAVTDQVSDAHADAQARWAVLPLENTTTTPMAGVRAQAVSRALLHTLGVADVLRPPAPGEETLFDPAPGADMDAMLAWAREAQVRYLLTGTVDEWRYKVGIDGEPVVGLALHIIDVEDGTTVWSGVGARTGWGRESLAGTAQKLLKSLLTPVVN